MGSNQSEISVAAQRDKTASALAILELLAGQWMARCIQVAADLDLADCLNHGPRSVQELAQATNTHAPTLYRLLRSLASRGIFVEVEPGSFAHTELSEALRTDRPGSMHAIAKLYGSEWQWRAWRDLEYSIRTGKAAVEHVYEQKLWGVLAAHPEDVKLFQQAMTSTSEVINKTLAQAYDFAPFETVVDVGGGHGSLLMEILRSYPASKGILFDLPQVIESAQKRVEPELQTRMRSVAGDFFVAVPEGGDVYLMKQVLHDWSDEDCVRILTSCHRVMKPGSKLLVLDTVIGSAQPTETSLSEMTDMLMLVIHAGRERTVQEFADLFAASHFRLSQVISTGSPVGIVEGIPITE